MMGRVLVAHPHSVDVIYPCISALKVRHNPSALHPLVFHNQHDLTDEADSSVVLAGLQGVLLRDGDNHRLSEWGRPLSRSPDPDCYRSLSKHHHGLPACLLEQVLMGYF